MQMRKLGTLIVLEEGKRVLPNLLEWLIAYESEFRLVWVTDWKPGDANIENAGKVTNLLFVTSSRSSIDFLYAILSYSRNRPPENIGMYLDVACTNALDIVAPKLLAKRVWRAGDFGDMESWLSAGAAETISAK
jgi:hypothetical protein